ncbi:hypothetical protein KVR01_010346 [Diaporthe batatas]|uniref:D-serine ammonia-lyase DSD1 n=1 Tax=Diaporthe batatas TaxID=748121 RepID=UPI001D0518C3|nr:D-serine ammonia-lyase DSD1 [Diaporthe batatas]KAG8159709.1 hypothetical protein KVR01_010346 [Diaporthe batatas]
MSATVSKAALQERFVGKTLQEVPTPSIVLDMAKLEVNCQRMIDAADKNGIGWRAHIKTHKTEELTRLQVGEHSKAPANIIVSTILEAEKIAPVLKDFQNKGRDVNVLFAFPLFPSAVPRLAAISRALGPNALAVMIDNPAQVPLLADLRSQSGGNRPLAFLKIDVKYNRAGAIPGTQTYHALLKDALAAEADGSAVLHGLYAHAGQSYYTRGDWDALMYLTDEFATLAGVAAEIRAQSAGHALTLSVGATPTATALQHPGIPSSSSSGAQGGAQGAGAGETGARVATLASLIGTLKADGLALEVHAGVYPTLDLQQLATHARDSSLLGSGDIAISVVAEVASLYAGRGAAGSTEALVNAGSLALGREPCRQDAEGHYAGWGVVAPWGEPALEASDPAPAGFPAVHRGWQVDKISQEHGVLAWKGDKGAEVPLRFGQRHKNRIKCTKISSRLNVPFLCFFCTNSQLAFRKGCPTGF